jgi:hypothetical protein
MIDRHHGHLARGRGEHVIRLLDALKTLCAGTFVDARWAPRGEHIAELDNK